VGSAERYQSARRSDLRHPAVVRGHRAVFAP
jgi:hypothetical protein